MEELDPNILKLLKKFKAKPRLERSVNSLLTRKINENKLPKYKDKTKYFSDNIDFDKAPTQEEYENYKTFFDTNDKTDNINIKESNRLKLALRYRDFFNKEGIEKSDSIERENFVIFNKNQGYDEYGKYIKTYFNLGELKNNALIKRFSEQRNKKLVNLINKNVNFDTYSSLSTYSQDGFIRDKTDNYINIRNKMKLKDSVSSVGEKYYFEGSEEHENRYQIQSNNTERYYGYDKYYNKYYPENIYRTVLDTEDEDFMKVNELKDSKKTYRNEGYSYHARDFNRYNLEEQLNFGLSRPSLYDEKGKHTGLSKKATYLLGPKNIYIGKHYGQNRSQGGYFIPTVPIKNVEELSLHEGLHGSEYPYGKIKTTLPGSISGFGQESPTNPTHLSGLDAILGLAYKQELKIKGPNPYKNQNMEFGAWFEQQLLQSKDEGEFSGDALFSGINFKKENKKEDPGLAKRNRIKFLQSILD